MKRRNKLNVARFLILLAILVTGSWFTGCADPSSDSPDNIPANSDQLASNPESLNHGVVKDRDGSGPSPHLEIQSAVACSLNVDSPNPVFLSKVIAAADTAFLSIESTQMGKQTQRIPMPAWAASIDPQRAITCIDINFDGWEDVGVIQDRSMPNSSTEYWTYRDRLTRFESIGVFATLTIEPEDQRVESYQRHGYAGLTYSQTTYEWQADSLIVSRDINQTMESNDRGQQIFIRTVRGRIDDTLTVVQTEQLTVRPRDGEAVIDTTVLRTSPGM